MKAVVSNINNIKLKGIKGIIFGVITGIISLILLLLIISFIITKSGNFPTDLIIYISLATVAVASFSGGYISGRINKSNGLKYGLFTGIILFIIILVAGITVNNLQFTFISLYKLIIVLIFSSIGGVLATNRKEKIHIK